MNSLLLLASVALAEDFGADDVARMALDHDPSLVASHYESEGAWASVAGEQHRYGLSVGWSAALSHVESPTAITGGISKNAQSSLDVSASLSRDFATGTAVTLQVGSSVDLLTDGYAGNTARLTVSQPLGSGSGSRVGWSQLHQAESAARASDADLLVSANNTVNDALTAWYELEYAREAVAVDEEALITARRQRDEAAARIDAGSLAPVELAPFETQVASLQESLARSRANERTQRITLSRMLGIADLPPLGAVSVPDAPMVPSDAVQGALAASPAIRSSTYALDLAQQRASVAGNGLLPTVSALGWVQVEDLAGSGLGTGLTDAWSGYVGLSGSLDLDRNQYKSQIAVANYDAQAAGARLDGVREQVAAQVQIAVDDQTTANERVLLAERTLSLAREQLAAAEAKYETGSGLAVEVSQAQDEVRSAELRVLRARVDAIEAALDIAEISGGLVAGN